jgi:hypothetical protein
VSFVHTLSSLMRTRENFPVGHPSQIAPSQALLTWRFFRDRLPKKKMHLVGMNTLLILLSLGPGYHHPRDQDITVASFGQCYLGRGQARARRRFLSRPWSSLPRGMPTYREGLVQLSEWPPTGFTRSCCRAVDQSRTRAR